MKTIGTQVLVKAVASRGYEGQKRYWYSLPFFGGPVMGVISGLGKRYDGKVERGYGGEEPEPSYFEIHKRHTVWLVRFGISRKEVPVFDRDLEVSNTPWTLPYQ
jgi:hypothetical protein